MLGGVCCLTAGKEMKMAESKRIELTVTVSLDMDALMEGVKEAAEKAVSVSGIAAESVTESPDAFTTIPIVRREPL